MNEVDYNNNTRLTPRQQRKGLDKKHLARCKHNNGRTGYKEGGSDKYSPREEEMKPSYNKNNPPQETKRKTRKSEEEKNRIANSIRESRKSSLDRKGAPIEVEPAGVELPIDIYDEDYIIFDCEVLGPSDDIEDNI